MIDGFAFTSLHDISFGNRIMCWELAQTINKLNNYEYNIVVEDNTELRWGEMKWLKYPNTFSVRSFPKEEQIQHKGDIIYDIQNLKSFILDSDKKLIHLKVSVECYHWLSDSTNIVFETYKKTNHRPIFDIEIYDKKLETIIKSEVDNRVGIHLRGDTPNGHWNFKDTSNAPSRKEYVKEQLDRYVERGLNKFYLSTDIFTNPYQRCISEPYFEGYHKGILGEFDITLWSEDTINKDEEYWKDAFYEFDKEEYLWINRVNSVEEILSGNGGKKQDNWVKELYDEYDIIDYRSVLKKYDTYLHNLDKLRCIDVIDLFSLIYSVEFIDNLGNGDGTFARFIKNYRKKFE